MKWYNIEDKFPEPGDKIVAKTRGCKFSEWIVMTVREGEGLGHIEEWCYYVGMWDFDKTKEEKE